MNYTCIIKRNELVCKLILKSCLNLEVKWIYEVTIQGINVNRIQNHLYDCIILTILKSSDTEMQMYYILIHGHSIQSNDSFSW